MSNQAPFRYDVVGSFLRPEYLKDARAKFAEGKITEEQLKETEDKAIKELVRLSVLRYISEKTNTESEKAGRRKQQSRRLHISAF